MVYEACLGTSVFYQMSCLGVNLIVMMALGQQVPICLTKMDSRKDIAFTSLLCSADNFTER